MNKGFTLVELLATVIIISLLGLLVGSVVVNLVKASKEDMYKIQQKNIEEAAKIYVGMNPDYTKVNTCIYFTYKNLADEDLLDETIVNPKDKLNIDMSSIVKVTFNKNSLGKIKDTYEFGVNLSDVVDCRQVFNTTYYENGTIVYYDIIQGKTCSQDTYNLSYDSTSKTYLNSKDGYNGTNPTSSNQNSCLRFYAYNDTDDNQSLTLNLILDHSTSLSIDKAEKFNQLKEDTKLWHETKTSKSYDGFSYEDINARFFSLNELMKIYPTIEYFTNTLSYDIDLNNWIMDISKNSYWVTFKSIDDIYISKDTNTTFKVDCSNCSSISSFRLSKCSIRPVITVDKKNLIVQEEEEIIDKPHSSESPVNWFTYTDNTDGTITVTGFSSEWDNTTDIVIPKTHDGKKVTTIGNDAFRNNQLTSVTIPNSVTTIGNSAFESNELTSVTIPNSVTTIGSHSFFNNELTSVTIPNSVTTIGNNAFYNNQISSVTIPNSVTAIEDGVFRNNQLTSVTIPNSVTKIGMYAFDKNKLTSVTIPSSVTKIGKAAFRNNQISSVTIPNSVTTIGNSAFENNKLTSVTIPSSVTSLDSNAFDSGVTITRK